MGKKKKEKMKYRERIKLERESSPEKKRGRKGERMVIFRIIDSFPQILK